MPVNHPHRIPDADINRANAIDVGTIARARGYVFDSAGRYAGPCPHCGGVDRLSISVRKQAFRCRGCHDKGGGGAVRLVMFLDRVGFRKAVETLIGERSAPVKFNKLSNMAAKKAADAEYERRQREKANWLWSQRRPITGSIAEKYLREVRRITCPLPPTLAFLPPTKPGYHAAMISAFGICDEVESGIIAAPREIVAVHLTLLKPDGSNKIEVVKPDSNKIMIGSPTGWPIVVAPPNDLLGLAITEGIENALSVHQALGLGAWAAGAAGFMPKLADAVPDWIDSISIFADPDADQQGERNATQLAERLNARGIFAEVLS